MSQFFLLDRHRCHRSTLFQMGWRRQSNILLQDTTIQQCMWPKMVRNELKMKTVTGQWFLQLSFSFQLMEECLNYRSLHIFLPGFAQLDELGNSVSELLHDFKRVEYHKSYLASLLRAMRWVNKRRRSWRTGINQSSCLVLLLRNWLCLDCAFVKLLCMKFYFILVGTIVRMDQSIPIVLNEQDKIIKA